MLQRLAFPGRLAILALYVMALLFAGAASAAGLDEARRAGLVGETLRGYIAPVSAPSPTTTQLVNDINAQRRAQYQSLAQKHGTSLDQIEILFGQRLIERAPAGSYVQDQNGSWRRK